MRWAKCRHVRVDYMPRCFAVLRNASRVNDALELEMTIAEGAVLSLPGYGPGCVKEYFGLDQVGPASGLPAGSCLCSTLTRLLTSLVCSNDIRATGLSPQQLLDQHGILHPQLFAAEVRKWQPCPRVERVKLCSYPLAMGLADHKFLILRLSEEVELPGRPHILRELQDHQRQVPSAQLLSLCVPHDFHPDLMLQGMMATGGELELLQEQRQPPVVSRGRWLRLDRFASHDSIMVFATQSAAVRITDLSSIKRAWLVTDVSATLCRVRLRRYELLDFLQLRFWRGLRARPVELLHIAHWLQQMWDVPYAVLGNNCWWHAEELVRCMFTFYHANDSPPGCCGI